MSKLAAATKSTKPTRDEILAQIKDPAAREHYRMQLEMAAELEADGVQLGGIFEQPDNESIFRTSGVPETQDVAPPEVFVVPAIDAEPPPGSRSFAWLVLMLLALTILVAALLQWVFSNGH